MQQLQGSHPSSGQPDRLSTFPINHKNPYDQINQEYTPSSRYISTYQSSADVSERTSLLIQADATLTIDKQLSHGWYACYKYWLYFLAFPSIVIFLYQINNVSGSPYMIFKIFRLVSEVAYAVVMTDALKNKKLQKAILGFKLAMADLVFLILQMVAMVAEMRSHFDENKTEEIDRELFSSFGVFILLSLGLFLYCGLGVAIPAWKVKGLLEKREDVLRKDANLYDF